jgi:hypothetical protein
MIDMVLNHEHRAVQELSGVELAYAFAQAARFELFGTSNGPFALLAKDKRSIFIFGGSAESIRHSSFEGNLADMALQTAQELGAKLYVENGMAKCCIGQKCAFGENFVQALMRAVVLDDTSGASTSYE